MPAVSETFVYREILGLRNRGLRVSVVTVRPTDAVIGDPQVEALADEAVPIYGGGLARLLVNALAECWSAPARSVQTAWRVVRDALAADERPMARLKLLIQGVGSLALARRLRPLGITHIHAHFAHVPATFAMYTAGQLGVGFSFTGHANDLFVRRSLLKEKLQRARFVACISHWHRRFYRELLPDLSDERLPVVRCGVDVPSTVRSNGTAIPLILGVGRLVAKKGFDTLLESLHVLASQGMSFRCRLIGDGPQQSRLADLAGSTPLAGRVELCGEKSHSQVLDELAQADLFVLPCRPAADGDRDGIPVVLMEAMAAGVPVIAGDLPAIRELVANDSTGLLVPPADRQSLTDAIRALLEDPTHRAALGQAGRERVRQEFATDINLDRLMEAFTYAA